MDKGISVGRRTDNIENVGHNIYETPSQVGITICEWIIYHLAREAYTASKKQPESWILLSSICATEQKNLSWETRYL